MRLFHKFLTAFYFIKYLNKDVNCSATGMSFNILEFMNSLLLFPKITKLEGLNDKECLEGLMSLDIQIPQKISLFAIQEYKIFGLLFLIWKRYAILKPELTLILMSFYLSTSKEEAENIILQYCKTYLESTINPLLSNKKKFIVEILESNEEQLVKFQIRNDEYGFITDTPRAMSLIVNQISEKEFGLN